MRSHVYPRHCERSEAIHCHRLCGRMDCFASLAMTRDSACNDDGSHRVGKGAKRRAHIYHLSRCEMVGTLRSAHPTKLPPHNSRAFENANELTRRVFSSKISVRVIGGSARWAQFSRSQSRQLTPIGVPSAFSRSIPAA